MTPVNDSEIHSDLYSVSPAAMSDEQIALRDAMTVTAVDQAESVAAIAASLHSLLDGLCKSVERLERERDEMRTLGFELFKALWENKSMYLIPQSIAERALKEFRAEKLLAGG